MRLNLVCSHARRMSVVPFYAQDIVDAKVRDTYWLYCVFIHLKNRPLIDNNFIVMVSSQLNYHLRRAHQTSSVIFPSMCALNCFFFKVPPNDVITTRCLTTCDTYAIHSNKSISSSAAVYDCCSLITIFYNSLAMILFYYKNSNYSMGIVSLKSRST